MNQQIKTALFGIAVICALIATSCSSGSVKTTVAKTGKTASVEKKDVQPQNGLQNDVSANVIPADFRAESRPNASQPRNNLSLNDLRTSFQSKPQEFILSAKTDTVIVGKAGTRVHIPSASFVDGSGKDAEGEIVFSLIECYTPLEMYAHNLSTITTNGELLETGGSVFLDAKQADGQLQLKPGRKLQVDFPKGETDLPGMQEFKGVTNAEGVVEWDSESPGRGVSKTDVFSVNRKEPLGVVSMAAPQIYLIEMKAEAGKTDLSSVKWNTGEGTLADWLEKQNLKDGLLRERFTNGYKVELRMSFDKKGKVSELKSTRLVEQSLLDELYRFFLKAPAVDMSDIQSRQFYTVILEAKTITNGKELKEYYTKNNLEWKSGYEGGLSKTGDHYTLNIGWIGWVNCDRFAKDTRQKVSMVMQVDDSTSVFLIFSKIASQIRPVRFNNTLEFHAIPLGEPIRLIALRIENDAIFMEKTDTEVTSGWVKVNPGARVSKEEVQSAFEL